MVRPPNPRSFRGRGVRLLQGGGVLTGYETKRRQLVPKSLGFALCPLEGKSIVYRLEFPTVPAGLEVVDQFGLGT